MWTQNGHVNRRREGLRVSLEGKVVLNVEGQVRSPFSLHATPTRVLDRYVSGLAHMLRIVGLLLHYRRHSEWEGSADTSDSVISFPVHLSTTCTMHKNAYFIHLLTTGATQFIPA